MVPTPARISHPLHPRRRPDEQVLRRGVPLRIVGVVCPLIHVLRPGFGDLFPGTALFHHRHAQRRQHAVDLLFGNGGRVLDDEQVHVILDVRQVLAVPFRNRHRTAHPGFVVGIADRRHLVRLLREALDLVGIICPQLLRYRAVPAADMNNDAAFDAGLAENVRGLVSEGRG